MTQIDMPAWPQVDTRLFALPAGTLCALVTAWERATYPARLTAWRQQWQPRAYRECQTQRYVTLPPAIDVAGWRRAMQGCE